MATTDYAEQYATALDAQRDDKNHFFSHDPYSPIPFDERDNFEGLNYYPANLDLRLTLPLNAEEREPITFQTSTGDQQEFQRVGTVTFSVDGEETELAIYQAEEGDYFLPFRDGTSGKDTYGAGRYLEPFEIEKGTLMVDFNLAYNPFCAYSEDYSCPLPPVENWLKVAIRAGEKNYHDDH